MRDPPAQLVYEQLLPGGSLAAALLFMQSPLACGLVAMAYPFCFTTLLVLRAFYPAALEPGRWLRP